MTHVRATIAGGARFACCVNIREMEMLHTERQMAVAFWVYSISRRDSSGRSPCVRTRIARLTGNPLPELISRANCVSRRVFRRGKRRIYAREYRPERVAGERSVRGMARGRGGGGVAAVGGGRGWLRGIERDCSRARPLSAGHY